MRPKFRFTPRISRRIPDPMLPDSERHIFLMRAKDLPGGLPKDPNPRDQNIDRRVYREVFDSLLNIDCERDTFHLKNKGITLIAASVKRDSSNKDSFWVSFDDGQGIVDGAHTYEIILKGQEEQSRELSDSQFVKVEVLVGVPESFVTEIAGGLNTAVQVQEMSLANLDERFDWIKEALKGEPYESVIGYKENEEGKELDIRDIIAYMTLFNIGLFPNNGDSYPIQAYRSKQTTLRTYLDKQNSYEKLEPILPDILKLKDIVNFNARNLHNSAGGRGGNLTFVESRKRGEYEFPFIGKQGRHRLAAGALFPMLGAFRWMVVEGDEGAYEWRGSFEDVDRLWNAIGAELMRLTQTTNAEHGRNPNAIGKSRSHWATLHSVVAKQELMVAAGR